MYTITKEIEFDMGHRVTNHRSKCRNIHGHRYRLQVTLTGDIVDVEGESSQGMLIDFTDIKDIATKEIHDVLDHGFMIWTKDPLWPQFTSWKHVYDQKIIEVDFVPTAENLAQYIWDILKTKYEDKFGTGLKLHNITLWETPKSFVQYSA